MSIPLSSNFDLQAQLPLDNRIIQADSTARDAIALVQRYFGLIITQLDDGTSWILANAAMGGTDNNLANNANWIAFGGSSITTGDLTDAGTDGITVTGGTGAVVGTGTSLSQHVSDTTHNGYLSSTDWNTFNGKLGTVSVTAPLNGNGTSGSPVIMKLPNTHIYAGDASGNAVDSGANFTWNGSRLVVQGTSGANSMFINAFPAGNLFSLGAFDATHQATLSLTPSLNEAALEMAGAGGVHIRGFKATTSSLQLLTSDGTSDVIANWPQTNGTAGQVLTTNGLNPATLSWSTAAAGTIGGSIATTQVGYGSAANTLTSDTQFTRALINHDTVISQTNMTGGVSAINLNSASNEVEMHAWDTSLHGGVFSVTPNSADLFFQGASFSSGVQGLLNGLSLRNTDSTNQYTWLWPQTDGTVGQVLTTDGNAATTGQLSWTTPTGGGITGTGAATQVAFWDTPNSISGDYSLWFDQTNGRLGVGQSAPSFDIDAQNITSTSIDAAVYFGFGGLDDLTNGGTFTGTMGLTYDVLIDGNDGTVDTFQWTDGFTTVTGVPITGAAQNLSFGVTITFGATTGHAIGTDEWGWDTHVTLGVGVINVSGSSAQYNLQGAFFASRDASNNYAINTTGIDGAWSDVTALGALAGNGVTQIQGTYIGSSAGSGATGAFQSTFVGYLSGQTAVNASQSVFLGAGAGQGAMNANNALFMGTSAGASATDAFNSVFIGQTAGDGAATANDSIFIGNQAGLGDAVDNGVGHIFIQYSGIGGGTFAVSDSITASSGGTGTIQSVNQYSMVLNTWSGAVLPGDTITNGAATATVVLAEGTTSILIGKTTLTGGFNNSVALGAEAINTADSQFMIGGLNRQIHQITAPAYPSTRDDTALATPINFLYTDDTGNVLSSPITSPTIVGSADLTSQTSAITDILALGTGAYTPSVDGSYKIGGYVTVNSILLTPILNVWVDYVNQEGTAIHKALIFQTISNTPSSVVTIQAATSYFVYDFEIRAQAGTAITFSTTQTGTIDYDIGISLMYMSH